jgi:hypothetical protein
MAINSFKAGESISAGDAVALNSAGLLVKANALEFDTASVVGVAIDAGARVNADAIYDGGSGFTPGEYRYLSAFASGVNVNYAAWASGLALTAYEGAYLSIVGRALTTTKLEVETSRPLFVTNPTSVILLESSAGSILDAMLQEDGSTIDLETA